MTEVKKEFTKIKTQEFPKASEFEKFLASSGQTVSDLLLRVKLNLLSQKIQKKIVKDKGTVTAGRRSPSTTTKTSRSYGTPEKRNVQIILTKTEAAAKSAKKEVESGKSFASVAKSVSIDPTSKANGGLLKEVVQGEEEKALDTAIFSTGKNVLERSRQDAIRLLHLRGPEHHARHPADAGAGAVHDQAAADLHRGAGGAQQVRERIQKEVDRQNGMSLGLRGRRLQVLQSAEDELHRHIGHRVDGTPEQTSTQCPSVRSSEAPARLATLSVRPAA